MELVGTIWVIGAGIQLGLASSIERSFYAGIVGCWFRQFQECQKQQNQFDHYLYISKRIFIGPPLEAFRKQSLERLKLFAKKRRIRQTVRNKQFSYNFYPEKQNIISVMNQFKSSSQFFDKYRIQIQIGRGASGICYRVKNTQDKTNYAMKKIPINSTRKNSAKDASNQVAILAKMQHPNIIRYLQSFADQSDLYIIMEYAPKGDLHNILKRRRIKKDSYSEQQIWEMCRQLLSALEYLHRNSIVHRDVKTLNIFVDNAGKLYLGDLGVSRIIKNDVNLYSRVGTPLYLAPQIIKYEKYDYKADVWGMGCVAYLLSTFNHPFEGKNIISLGQNIVYTQPKSVENYSQKLNRFIFQMLEKNPLKRPSPSELIKKYISPNLACSFTSKELLSSSKQFISEKKLSPSILPTNIQNGFEGKSANIIRRKLANNFLAKDVQQNFIFNEDDKIKEEDLNKSIKRFTAKDVQEQGISQLGKKFDHTIVFTRKTKINDQQKKYGEITYKNNSKQESQVSLEQKGTSQNQIIKLTPKQQNINQNKIFRRKCSGNNSSEQYSEFFSPSQKAFKIESSTLNDKCQGKIIVKAALQESSSSCFRKSIEYSSQVIKNNNASGCMDINKLASEHKLTLSNKIQRVRPKSSIMNKQRQQSTIRILKKSVRKFQFGEYDNYIQTQVLKKPQMVIL